MNIILVDAAVAESERFISACEALKNRHALDMQARGEKKGYLYDHPSGSKQTASVRRASMDLTRALARLRTEL